MSLFKHNEKKQQKEQQKLKEDVQVFLQEVNEVIKKHKIGFRPIITKYGLDVEYFRTEN